MRVKLELCDPFLCSWNCKWVEMNTCFSTSLKPLFLQPFSKCRFTFCLVCGCYFRNVSCGGGGGTLRLILHACALTTLAQTQERTHRHMHAAQPLTTPPRAFSVYLRRTSGFGLLFSLLIQHPVQSAFLFFFPLHLP